ncbi:methoxymalonate biosynthesis acyl carrier protein [Thermocatellispora tengchongensis]|uniref:Methoxymalonate biosynthesis acyl carrier protein n=1 Tax=Thermocatellispora tengchongensis TaxID=1073253 RepID=A0A840P7Z6_9ACTN|nr:acyl carrier protein [Thermocatellispora tengchongensis]MBB5137474.1 methoxymalonate biosynthesis acyl carrier protein [Thermocatellispora tengchongensis]
MKTSPLTAEAIESAMTAYLTERTKTEVKPDDDIFASGLVSSMFAMELVVHLESTYDIAIIGPELKIDNFRTAKVMAALVLRLSEDGVASDA